MKLSNWFKIPWWVFITSFSGYIFYLRWGQISTGNSAPVDVFIFLVFVALLLAPIFQEISFWGLKFKQEVEQLKEYISTQNSILKSDIQNTISNSVNTHVTVSGTPPPDNQLPRLEERIRETLRDYLGEPPAHVEQDNFANILNVNERINFLFRTRYLIEKNLRDISNYFGIEEDYSNRITEYSIKNIKRRPIPIYKLSSILIDHQILDPKIAHAIREVYAVCSPAVHGEEVTDAQFEFVRDLGPEIIRTLEKIKEDQGIQ